MGRIALFLYRIDIIEETKFKYYLSIIAYNTGYIKTLDFIIPYLISELQRFFNKNMYKFSIENIGDMRNILHSDLFNKKRYIETIVTFKKEKDIKSQNFILLIEVAIHIYTMLKTDHSLYVTALKNYEWIYHALHQHISKKCSQDLYEHILDRLIKEKLIDGVTILHMFGYDGNDKYLIAYMTKIISDYSSIPNMKSENKRLEKENKMLIEHIKAQPDGETFLSAKEHWHNNIKQ